jgi:histidinol-phosphate aminotransferase
MTSKSSTDTTDRTDAVEKALRHVKPAVRALSAYSLSARPAPVKLNQNENPYDVPASVKRRVMEKALARPWSRYPGFDPQELLDALARFSGWRADGILAGNGSNELIEALMLVTVGQGTRVVIPEPTFTLYALLTGILGGTAVRVPLGPDFEYEPAALSRARRESEAPVTIVCSPNNPTGGVLAADDLRRLCQESDRLVIVDEAYHEFSGQTAVPLLAEHPNLVVLRTFSKALGAAGLRLGYLLAAPEIVREVNKARLPYNLNFFSEAAALAILEAAPAFGEVVGRLIAMRDQLVLDLAALPGVRAFPSQANFILFELAEAPPRRVFEELYAQGVLVRDVSAYPRLQRCLRVTVGSEDENAAFLGALRASLGIR